MPFRRQPLSMLGVRSLSDVERPKSTSRRICRHGNPEKPGASPPIPREARWPMGAREGTEEEGLLRLRRSCCCRRRLWWRRIRRTPGRRRKGAGLSPRRGWGRPWPGRTPELAAILTSWSVRRTRKRRSARCGPCPGPRPKSAPLEPWLSAGQAGALAWVPRGCLTGWLPSFQPPAPCLAANSNFTLQTSTSGGSGSARQATSPPVFLAC